MDDGAHKLTFMKRWRLAPLWNTVALIVFMIGLAIVAVIFC